MGSCLILVGLYMAYMTVGYCISDNIDTGEDCNIFL
jgi:hypothetical protein